jgi:hypothetical protein
MVASKVEIINNSLQKCGEIKIQNLDEDVKAAREASTAWDMARRSTLTMYRWNFAKRRAQLAASATEPLFGFTYQMPVPSDFLALIGVYDDNQYSQNYTSGQDPYVMEGTDTQRVILSDTAPLYITYVKDITDTAQFDPLYDEVLACHLALRLAYPLSTSLERIASIEKELVLWENRAKLSNAIQNTPEIFQASTWLDSRFQGDNYLRRGPVV